MNDVASGTGGVLPVRIVEHRKNRPVVTISLNLAAVAKEQMISELLGQLRIEFALGAEDKCALSGQWHGVSTGS